MECTDPSPHLSASAIFCLARGTDIAEHTSTRNAVVQVLEGQGTLTLNGEDVELVPGRFVFMPANAPHALKATENLAFLLTLSDPVPSEN
ncbi:cupin domain-containing protein [Nodosilinea sp. LEGE 07298]|nr:cupin domain-containing protein [Nodosilinea sp. LEGE 07298]